MIRVILHDGETIEARDSAFDISPLGVKHADVNTDGIKTGEWWLIPWVNISRVRRFKNPPGVKE